MLFTIRIVCGCGCESNYVLKWGLTPKGSNYIVEPGWEEPSKLSVSQLPEAFTYIKDWQSRRGGNIGNILLERAFEDEKVLRGSPGQREERTAKPVFPQKGFCVCGW